MVASKDLVFTVLGIDKASKTFDKVGESMDRMGKRAVIALGGVTAASSASALAVGATVGALPLAFAGFGAFALRENTRVRQSFENLSETVRTGLAADAAPLEQAYVGAAEQIGASYQRLRPQLQRAFGASVPLVKELTGGVLDFAENAMPGMVRSVERAGPAVAGLRTLLGDTGTGFSEFFDNISEHSEAAGDGFESLGRLVQETLSGTGSTLGTLTDLWAEHGEQVVDVVTGMGGALGELSGGALPVLSSSLSVVLDVLQGVIGVIEPMSGVLGPVIGMWLALGVAMKGLRGVRSVVDSVATSVTSFGTAAGNAAGSKGVSKFRAVAGGLMGMMGGPFGLAVAGAAAVIGVFGQKAQEAADDQRALTDALRQSNGEFDQSVRSTIVSSNAYQDIAGYVDAAGISQRKFVDALIAGGPELERMKARLSFLAGIQPFGLSLSQIDDLRAQITAAEQDAKRYGEATDALAGSMLAGRPGADALRESLTTLGDQTADTADKADALNDAWRRLFGIEIGLEEATANWEEGLAQLTEQIQGVQGETANWQAALLNADGSINTTTEAGRNLLGNLIEQGDEYRTLAQTAYDTAISQGQSQQQATQAARDAVNERRAQFIREMEALGFTETQAQELANRYLGMPKDVYTAIHSPGMAAAIGAARSLVGWLNSIPSSVSTTISVAATGPAWLALQGMRALGHMRDGGLVEGYANGGRVQGFPNGGQVRGPGGPRDDLVPAMLSNGEFVMNARATRRYLPLLEVMNAQKFANGGLAGAAAEILGRLKRGGSLFEDFSYHGMDDTVGRYQRELSDRFYRSHRGFDFGGPGTTNAVTRFLQQLAAPTAGRSREDTSPVRAGSGDELFLAWLRKVIKVRGGNVQLVLGS
ncbi:hypothetical protein BAY59_24280 [Prauserella coralliicola]|nr:hypothetical protein BAY59_24280 [Prauserella coralliicola]